MTLRLSFNSLTAGIVNFLAANSATINSGIAANLAVIKAFRPDNHILNDTEFPALSVDLKSHTEEQDDVGYLRKRVVCTWAIGAHVKNIESLSVCVGQLYSLVENVELVFRSDVRLSNTFHESVLIGADFDTVVKARGAYQRNASIGLQTVHYIQ